MKSEIKLVNKGFTHAGVFHADDVFSTAFLQILNPDFTVERGFRVPDNFDGIVYDVGGGDFDHHSEPRETRPNGVPYAAFGKLFRVFGALTGLEQNELTRFDEQFIAPLDASDNGGEPSQLAQTISAFNPLWDKAEDQDEMFWKAVAMAKLMLEREFERYRSHQNAMSVARAVANQDGKIAVLDAYAPVIMDLIDTDKVFLVYPSNRGGWNAQVVPVAENDRTAKVPFPHEWWGRQDTLPDGATFCHASGFLLATNTKEQAVNACLTALAAAN